MRVFDPAGREVVTLADRVFPAGRSQLRWDGNDSGGKALPSGVYLYTLDAEGRQLSGKTMLVR